MADDTARTSLTFDATGAKQGATDFQQAGQQVIQTNAAVEASENKTAATTEAAATRKSTARRTASQSAKDTAAIEAAAAAAGGDAIVNATNRIVTALSSQTRMLDNYSKQWDPFVAAASRAQKQLESIMDVIAQGGPNAARASTMIGEATQRLNSAQANLSLGANAGASIDQLTAKFAPAQASAARMTAELAQLNQALELGVPIEGGYAAAWAKIVDSYDLGAAAAKRAAAAQQELITQSRAMQDAANSQQNINQLTGVQTSPGSIGGNQINTSKSAADSAAVFQAQFDAEEKLAAENARLFASFNPIKTASMAYAATLADIDTAVERNIISEGQAEIARDKAAQSILGQTNAMRGGTEASGQMGFAVRQLGVQTVQFFSSVQGGQSVLTALIQQGHQVADVALSTGTGMGVLGTAAKAAFGFITSPVGLVIAAAATLTALGVAAESTARRIEVMRNSLALARPDFIATSQVAEAAAKDLARTTFLDTSQARGGVSGVFQALPNYSGTQQQLESIVLVMARVSKAVHDGTVEWSDLSAVLKSPSAYLETLGGRLGALDPLFTRHIRDLEAAGQGYKATAEVLALLNDRTKTQADNMTPLEKALHDLSVSLTGASQGGKSFVDTVGGPIVNTLATLITGVNSLVTALKALEQIKPGAGLQALAAVFSGFAGGAAVAGAVSDKIIGALNIPQNGYLGSASNAVNSAIGWTPGAGTAAAPGNLASVGSGPGQIVSSEAGGLTYQINSLYKSTFDGFINDLAATGYKINSLGGYNNRNIAGTGTPSYHAQGAAIDINPSDNPVNGGNNLPPNIAAIAAKWGLGWGGNWTGGKTDPMHFSVAQSEGGSVPLQHAALSAGGGGDGSGFGITAAAGAADSAEKLDKLRTSLGLVTDATTKYKGEQGLLEAALAAHPGDTGYAEALQKVQLALYDSVPAVTGQVRAIELDIAANNRLTTAWGENSKAASETAIQNKALTDALKIADPSTTQYAAAVAILTSELTKQAAAQERVQMAQASSVSRDNLTYLQAEISTLGMNYSARELLLTNLKNEQDLKRQYPNLSDAEIAARVKELGAVEQMTLALNQQKAGVDAIAGAFSQSFDTIGNAMAQAFVQGQGAAVNWQNVMASVIQQVIQQFAKLALLNPAMNFLFGQNNPTIDSTVQGLANGSGALSGLFKFLGGAGSSGADAISLGSSAINASGIGAFGIDSVAASILHDGGVASIGGEPRWVHAAYFDNAPRFHSGLGNDEVAAILQRGERVLTIAQTQNFDRMVKALPRFHDGMNNDGIGDMIDNFASTFAGGSSNQSSKDGQDGGDVHFHNNFNFGSAPANVDTFNRSATQIARKIGVTVRQEMGRGRN